MSPTNTQMPSARRRPIPGMSSPPPAALVTVETGAAPPARSDEALALPSLVPETPAKTAPEASIPGPRRPPAEARSTGSADRARRRPATDYASTRLVNFRIPVDLHDRYKQLVREIEQTHPRLRHPSLTEC